MTVSADFLKGFHALRSLRLEGLATLSRRAQHRSFQAGQVLYGPGDGSRLAWFIVQGQVELDGLDGEAPRRLTGGTPAAARPLGLESPRRGCLRALSDGSGVSVDADLLDITLSWDQAAAVEVGEYDPLDAASDDWMLRLLQQRSMRELPPAQLQALLLAMRPLQAEAGTRLIEQGDPGDAFYVIERGECTVYRDAADAPGDGGGARLLARFGAGDCFGEEALIAGSPRNASVIATRDSRLRRLDKPQFLRLLEAPLARRLSAGQAVARLASGRAVWLDLRQGAETRLADGATIVLPPHRLRSELGQLDRRLDYVCVCENGHRSRLANFLLRQRGFESYVLDGGIDALPR